MRSWPGQIAALATVLALATGGNLTVLLTGWDSRVKRSPHAGVRAASGSDRPGRGALPGAAPAAVGHHLPLPGPDPPCRAVKYLQVLSMFASTYMLLAMTLDRYLAVCHPRAASSSPAGPLHLAHRSPLAAGGGPQPPLKLLIFPYAEVIQGSECWTAGQTSAFPWGPRAYITWTTLAIFILPVAMLTACYSLICHEICKNLKVKTEAGQAEGGLGPCEQAICSSCPGGSHQGGCRPGLAASTISRAKIRTVKMTFAIVLASYSSCWAPLSSVSRCGLWDENAPDEGKCVVWLGR